MELKNDFRCYDLVMTQVLLSFGHLVNWVKTNKEDGKLIFYFKWDETLWSDARKLIEKKKKGERIVPYSKEVKCHNDLFGWTEFTDGTRLLDKDNPWMEVDK